MKLYSVFVDIGMHSDGWEPEDETDVRFLGTYATKERAIIYSKRTRELVFTW